eukprot:TRINITY_DN6088_c0_g1_i1.p1 TRINITY_DN6088_c0_g1~~TRINITY_DN6088_c0_g1_i1.p1  ORF type:complete len:263 (-),score=60.99 TRINITY_DN6088_c0_g1_i1:197-985(-)
METGDMSTMSVLSVLSILAVLVAADPKPPTSPLPYTTTMLRTHNYTSAEFLSIYEQLSVRAGTGHVQQQQAFHIFPGLPFSMRDANDTTILGIRVVYNHLPLTAQTETFYYLTDLNSNERCLSHKVSTSSPNPPVQLGNTSIRGGVPVTGWREDFDGGQSESTYYVTEARGPANANGTGGPAVYPFRVVMVDPAGGPEYGYVLDQGTHFPVAMDAWFDTSGCKPAQQHAIQHRPLLVSAGGVIAHDLYGEIRGDLDVESRGF